MKRRSRTLLTAIATMGGAVVLTACSGGSSDTVGGDSAASDGSAGTINLFAYAVPKPGFDKLTAAFQATDEGKNVNFNPSYGASGDQSRKVKDGAEADFVNFSVEPDITRLVDAGLVDQNWNQDAYNGIPFGSVVTIVTRPGNPKGIKTGTTCFSPASRSSRRTRSAPARPSGTSWRRTPPRATVARTAGGSRLRHRLGQRPRQDPAQVGTRGFGSLPAG